MFPRTVDTKRVTSFLFLSSWSFREQGLLQLLDTTVESMLFENIGFGDSVSVNDGYDLRRFLRRDSDMET